MDSSVLVPGSIIYLKEGLRLPCDCILLMGDCLVDEASLTGESVAVGKISYDPRNEIIQKGNLLYDGTTIV